MRIRRVERYRILSRIRTEAPQEAGVYLFYDRHGRVIYVGKSINLRRRMSGYFQESSRGMENRILRMVFSVTDFRYHVTGSELSALLMEDRLIKQHLPPFNTRQKEFKEYQYLSVTNDPYPTLKRLDRFDACMEENVFGPFKDKYFVDDLLEIIHKHFRLRSCKEPDPSKQCLNHDIRLCEGPCRRSITPSDYSRIVDSVVKFLNGEEGELLARLERSMAKSASELDFEGALDAKKRIAFCRGFCERQRFINRFKTGNLVIREKDNGLTHVFIRGGWYEHKGRASIRGLHDLDDSMLQKADTAAGDERHLSDRAHILYSWMRGNRNSFSHQFI